MNRKKMLIITLFITAMITSLIVPVFAAKPTTDVEVTIESAGNDYYHVTFVNTGGVRINIITIIINPGAEDWGPFYGWDCTFSDDTQAIFQTSGRYVLGRGDSVTFEFKAGTSFTCSWATGNRKGMLNYGDISYPSD